MDIRCKFCSEPWDHDNLHETWSQYWDEKVRSAARKIDVFSRAVEDVRKDFYFRNRPETEIIRAIESRARYFLNAELFRRFGCRAFGAECNPDGRPNLRSEVLQNLSDHPEEWSDE